MLELFVDGFPPRQRADLIWNRTVNVKGGAGECLAMDLVNEHCNQDFKGNKDFYLKNGSNWYPLINELNNMLPSCT